MEARTCLSSSTLLCVFVPLLTRSGVVIVRPLLLSTRLLRIPSRRSAFLRTTVICRESVVIAEVNADEDKVLSERFGITGFPTLKYFPAGEKVEAVDYREGRTAEDIINFINKEAGTLGCLPSS